MDFIEAERHEPGGAAGAPAPAVTPGRALGLPRPRAPAAAGTGPVAPIWIQHLLDAAPGPQDRANPQGAAPAGTWEGRAVPALSPPCPAHPRTCSLLPEGESRTQLVAGPPSQPLCVFVSFLSLPGSCALCELSLLFRVNKAGLGTKAARCPVRLPRGTGPVAELCHEARAVPGPGALSQAPGLLQGVPGPTEAQPHPTAQGTGPGPGSPSTLQAGRGRGGLPAVPPALGVHRGLALPPERGQPHACNKAPALVKTEPHQARPLPWHKALPGSPGFPAAPAPGLFALQTRSQGALCALCPMLAAPKGSCPTGMGEGGGCVASTHRLVPPVTVVPGFPAPWGHTGQEVAV